MGWMLPSTRVVWPKDAMMCAQIGSAGLGVILHWRESLGCVGRARAQWAVTMPTGAVGIMLHVSSGSVSRLLRFFCVYRELACIIFYFGGHSGKRRSLVRRRELLVAKPILAPCRHPFGISTLTSGQVGRHG